MPTSAEATIARTGRILVGGVGYRNLRDLSAGPLLTERLGAVDDLVDVEDLSYGPIDVLFALQKREPYRAAILVTAVSRGHQAGTVTRRTWDAPAISTEALQERVAEAVTGVISLENLLYICGHFGALPERVVVIEIEPAAEEWGEALSVSGQAAMDSAIALVRLEIAEVLGR